MSKLKQHLPLIASLWLLAGCAGSRQEVRLTGEPSMERALDMLNGTREGRPLINFLRAHQVFFEYSATPGLCHKFSLKAGKIQLPLEYKSSDLMLALAIARAGHIYRLYTRTGLDEIISEEEELAALFAGRVALEIGPSSGDFGKTKEGAKMKGDFCAYIMETSRDAMARARAEVMTPDTQCQRPLETLTNQRDWLEKIRKALNDETFYQLLYERDMQRAKKGQITVNDAARNAARLRGLPVYEVYRFQRTFYDKQSDVLKLSENLYADGLKEDEDWRNSRQAEIDRARGEFSDCELRP